MENDHLFLHFSFKLLSIELKTLKTRVFIIHYKIIH